MNDFSQLTSQLIGQLQHLQTTQLTASNATVSRRTPAQWNSLERYRQIRSASRGLYELFASRWSCAVHNQHTAAISAKGAIKEIENKKGGERHNIRFQACISPPDVQMSSPPLWLEIEYIDVQNRGPNTQSPKITSAQPGSDASWRALVGSLEKKAQLLRPEPANVAISQLDKLSNRLKKRTQPQKQVLPRKTKVVQFSTTTTIVATREREHSPFSESDEDTAISGGSITSTDLSQISDFCQHFSSNQLALTHLNSSSPCIGYLRNSGLHRFYPLPAVMSPSTDLDLRNTGHKSLAQLIASQDDPTQALPRVVAFHLASELASAVLQYHSTPWLPERWDSNQVYLYGIDDILHQLDQASEERNPNSYSTNLGLPSPFFQAEFQSKQCVTTRNTPPTTFQYPTLQSLLNTNNTISRNEILFSLGIILLELGYGRSFSRLRQSALVRQHLPQKKQTSDYHAAVKLAQSRMLREKMGLRYPAVVEKCLGCDFAKGDDLENEALQGAFLVDVVGTLRAEEGRVRGVVC